ncbi:hypothetical protein JCM11641_004171 [Rhodosporidiobolus odoratus]
MANPHAALKPGNTAVVTGAAAGGIGFAVAQLLLQRFSMHVVLADISRAGLEAASDALIKAGVKEKDFAVRVTDVTKSDDVEQLANEVYEAKGKVDFVLLNAGVQMPSKSYGGELAAWHKTLEVNLGGVVNGQQAFVERMVAQGSPAAVVVTGSKQGITNPPGNPAYNASKAAVKSLTEGLAHALLDTQVSAHLLVPGWTWTKLAGGGPDPDSKEKPNGPWTAVQVAEELLARLDEFYIICDDNDVTFPLDCARMQYNLDDILLQRPALSRWNPAYAEQYKQYVEQQLGGQKK